jgi:tRNA1Val (adenine37-N6)-methyltransferase
LVIARMVLCGTNPMDTHFRGWAIPGPIPPGASRSIEVPPDESLDAISGHFRIFQLRRGHRFSTDDVLTAWYGTTWAASARRVLDLGSGVGSVGMIAAWRLQGARFVTIEAQDESVRLARKSAEYNGLLDRFEIRHGDLRDGERLGADERFDLVLGSPPYFRIGAGLESDHPQKLACRFELRGDITDYCIVAGRHLAPGGLFACVFPEDQRARIDRAAGAGRLIAIRSRPVVFRQGDSPLLRLFAMMAVDDVPGEVRSWEEPPLVIRTADGEVHPEYSTVKLAAGFPP